MPALRRGNCHHYYLDSDVCRICGFERTPGNLREGRVVHRASWRGAHTAWCAPWNTPAVLRGTSRKVVTCLRCLVGAR